MITTTNPRTGDTIDTDIAATAPEQVAELAQAADAAFPTLAANGRVWRAGLLDALAQALEDDREALVETADAETGLGPVRLNGELTRSVFQFRMFADALREGGYLEATIDHAGTSPMGPVPDVRRMLLPIGPVGVFGASNFPFAFSVAGGDTASALAAGCPVLLKAHSSHPLTSKRSFEALSGAAEQYGAPAGTLGIVYGTKAGAALVADPRIKAVGFTGSLSGGQALLDIINNRDEPIPFYGELSSLNPLIITEGAANARPDEIAQGLFASFTGSAGQLCTKPGVAFVPKSEHGHQIVEKIAQQVREAKAVPLLNGRITNSFGLIRQRLVDEGKAEIVATGVSDGAGIGVAPSVLTIDADRMTPEVTEEAFGPLIVVAYYDDLGEVEEGLGHIPKSLTATIHSEDQEAEAVSHLAERVKDRAGRLVFNGYPTGVRVSWAQHHGGPWPATNSQHTSVGVTAVRRFLRPFVWQDAPEALLPEELRDGYTAVPRRVDGVLQLAGESADA
ncbi:aldehyde dehydrogenase (NADP(+)) [Lysobacter korlensis]|uniref:Aldehyde dehydrogenase (NADP(+)) n=1 Tax=Lysobacter korlensis TaxID=553636 RepID=A0ABV6RXY9_9GAMM